MTETTPLGWPVLEPGSAHLHTWVLPGAHRKITHLAGRPGFVLAVWDTLFDRTVERLDIPNKAEPVDEGGYSHRENRNRPGVWSEHAGGSADDLNWNRHPNGVPASHTFTAKQINLIHRRMRWWNRIAVSAVLRWGGDYRHVPDPMHIELFHNLRAINRLARFLKYTSVGREVRKANPSQVI